MSENLNERWTRFVNHPAVRTSVYGILLGLVVYIAFLDGIQAMDAIERSCAAKCQCSTNVTQMLNLSWKG